MQRQRLLFDVQGNYIGPKGVPWRPITLTRQQRNALHTYERRAPRVTLPRLPSLALPTPEVRLDFTASRLGNNTRPICGCH
jgi:hypothetical protein